MSTKMQVPAKAAPTSSFTPAASGLLQRKCACGGTAGLDGECAECRQKRFTTQPNSTGQSAPTATSASFGHDFGQVRVHENAPETIQTKLEVNEPGDKFEQEADRVADQVMRMPKPGVPAEKELFSQTSSFGIQRLCPECEEELHRQPIEEEEEEEELLQAKEVAGRTPEINAGLESSINRLRGGGQPLDSATRAFFEPRFGHDFSQVRVHSDSTAAETAKSINARAYTLNTHVVMGPDAYQPDSNEGRRLLAHELTHVLQQDGLPLDARDSTAKHEVRDVGTTVAAGRSATKITPQSEAVVSRADPDAVAYVGRVGVAPGTGIQFWPTNVTDTQVGPVSVRGGLLSERASRLNVIIGQNLTPRVLARMLLPLWTTATPFTPPGGGAAVPLDIIDEDTLAKGLLIYNQFYLPLLTMDKWQAGLRFPLPVEIDEATGMATLHPTLIRNLAGAWNAAEDPKLDQRAAATAAPPAATLTADVRAFLARETTALARGIHLGARAVTNAMAELPLVREAFNQLGAAGFDVALEFMDSLVNRQVALLAAQRDGAAILAEIRTAFGRAPASLSADQQNSLNRANHMLGLVAGAAAQAPPAATRTRAEKTVNIDTVKLDRSSQNPATQVGIANAIFAQCNVRFNHVGDETAPYAQTTGWLGGNTDLRVAPSCGATTGEERRMFRGAAAAFGLTSRIRAFFPATLTGHAAAAYSIPPYCATGTASRFRDHVVVQNGPDTSTLAHEIGHLLINHRGHPGTTVMTSATPAPALLNTWQCNRIYSRA